MAQTRKERADVAYVRLEFGAERRAQNLFFRSNADPDARPEKTNDQGDRSGPAPDDRGRQGQREEARVQRMAHDRVGSVLDELMMRGHSGHKTPLRTEKTERDA